MANNQDFNVFVGAETGLFKGININQQQIIAKNLNNLQHLDREQEITCMAWGNPEETEILMGLRSQKVRIYDTDFKGFSGCLEVSHGKGPLRGIGKSQGSIITAAESGHVKLWRFKASDQKEINAINTGETLSKMRVCPSNDNIIATGGKKNDLQLWDLTHSQQPLFKAKNVRNDFLDLAVPVWVSDLAFVPNSEQVVVCSRHGYVRLYDPKAKQRRPVIDCKPEEESWNAISVASHPNQIVIGSGKGRMLLFDMRAMKTIHAYRGFTGSIREIYCHPTNPLILSVGLDRFLRVHHYNDQKPVYKSYLKSRLNAILVRKDFNISCSVDEVPDVDSGLATDNLWNNMEVICENNPTTKKSRKRRAE